MYVYHNIRDRQCKQPEGAQSYLQPIELMLYCDIEQAEAEIEQVNLIYAYGLYQFSQAESRMQQISLANLQQIALYQGMHERQHKAAKNFLLHRAGGVVFYIKLTSIHSPHLFFYCFKLQLKSGQILYYNYQSDHSGNGYLTDHPAYYRENSSHKDAFTINLYDPSLDDTSKSLPLAGQIIYQIFPDRYNRSSQFDLNKFHEIRFGEERIYHDDWQDPVDYLGTNGNNYEASDFYGGDLLGVIEKLPYLASIGVKFIYFNPIFKARSNHRYDTADYLMIDELLGDDASFQLLIKLARQYGIGIILDLVINHCGADSVYFNRFGKYPLLGACQSEKSPFHSWFNFKNWQEPENANASDYTETWSNLASFEALNPYRELGELTPNQASDKLKKILPDTIDYDSWWGFKSLPTFNKQNLQFRNFVYGEKGFIRKWLRYGIAGYRIDVSDELPDQILRELYQAIKSENPQAVVIGEVWENPAIQVSYGNYRDFAFGQTHDSFMGYPFRTAILAFLRCEIDACQLNWQLEELRYLLPPAIFISNMHLLSSHDRPRFITAVATSSLPQTRALQSQLKLEGGNRFHGERCLLLATLLQMFYPGAPSIYYGDEVGMEGCYDPFNRLPMQWAELQKCEELIIEKLQLQGKFNESRVSDLINSEITSFQALDLEETLALNTTNLDAQSETTSNKEIINTQSKNRHKQCLFGDICLSLSNEQIQSLPGLSQFYCKMLVLYNLRAKYPILQFGKLRTLCAEANFFAIERYVEADGSAYFKQQVAGPKMAICAVNRSDQVWEFNCPAGVYQIQPWQGVAIIGAGEQVFYI